MKLSSEFQLVAACCRRPADAAWAERIRNLSRGADWPLVERIAARHRVEGLVSDALGRADVAVSDPEAANTLRAAARRIARENLQLTAESLRLRRVFEAAGIRLLFVKGIALGQLAWGSIGLKMGWDMDLLVAAGDVEAAAALLERDGYELKVPWGAGVRERLAFWHRHWKESVWIRREAGIVVELHTALSDNPALLGAVGIDSPTQEAVIGPGSALPTLAAAPLFAYLCIHGASSAWFRLKWIADVGALLAPVGPAGIERLYREALALGAGRAPAQALLLCHALFDTPVPEPLLAELRRDRMNRLLLTVAMRKLAGRAGLRPVEETPFGTASIHLMQLGLKRGLRFKLGELRRQLVSPYDRLALPLPRPLHFLYPLIFLFRRGGRRPTG